MTDTMQNDGNEPSPPTEDEDTIISFVKSNGQVPIPLHLVRSRTAAILSVMKTNRFNLRILRIGCHSISNIAMEIQNCEILVCEGVIESILSWIEEFITDWRICWLACSSLWNLARCKMARDRINVRGVGLVLDIIDLHCHSPLVMQTSLGALSNLCIDCHIKRKIGNHNTIRRCFEIMDRHPYDAKVLTSACGLITNLAYDEEIAQNITCHGIHKIVSCMAKHEKVNHLQRNASAALSNLSATSNFVQHLVTCGGIEALFRALDHHTDDADVTQLATGALQNLSIYGPTTSLHVSCTFCDCLITRQVLLNQWDEFMNINVKDVYGDTPLHSAIRAILSLSNGTSNALSGTELTDKNAMADRLDVLQFLIASGSDLMAKNKKNETPLSLIQFGESPVMAPEQPEEGDEVKSDSPSDNDIDGMNAMNAANAMNGVNGTSPRLTSSISPPTNSLGNSLNLMMSQQGPGDDADDDEDEVMAMPKTEKQKLTEKRLVTVVHMAIEQGKRHLRVIKKRFRNLVTATRRDMPIEIAEILSEYCHPLELSIAFRVELEPSFRLAKHSKAMSRDSIHVMNFDDCSDLMDVDL